MTQKGVQKNEKDHGSRHRERGGEGVKGVGGYWGTEGAKMVEGKEDEEGDGRGRG